MTQPPRLGDKMILPESNHKNRDRDEPIFANINFMGPCNANCYYCLGKDIEKEVCMHNHLDLHFKNWERFGNYLWLLDEAAIERVYLTGQNTDPLMYRWLDELIDYLQDVMDFEVGIRTNGYLTRSVGYETLNKCKRGVSFSMNSLKTDVNEFITGRKSIPYWDEIFTEIKKPRAVLVLNRYNYMEFFDIHKFLRNYPHLRYFQVRKVSTDTRLPLLYEDMEMFEWFFQEVRKKYPIQKHLFGAEVFDIEGLQTVFWRTVDTSVNSYNYFTDGTISTNYFVVEGYLENRPKTARMGK